MKQKNEKNKEKEIHSETNIVGKAYKDIMSEDSKENLDCEIEQHNELINPDPHSLDSRG